mgnify:FL=1
MEHDTSLFEKTFKIGREIKDTTNGVHVGALVSISPNASFWNGNKVERWYYLKKWYVTALEGNKASLEKDETGRYSIRVPISTNFLAVIKPAPEA